MIFAVVLESTFQRLAITRGTPAERKECTRLSVSSNPSSLLEPVEHAESTASCVCVNSSRLKSLELKDSLEFSTRAVLLPSRLPCPMKTKISLSATLDRRVVQSVPSELTTVAREKRSETA